MEHRPSIEIRNCTWSGLVYGGPDQRLQIQRSLEVQSEMHPLDRCLFPNGMVSILEARSRAWESLLRTLMVTDTEPEMSPFETWTHAMSLAQFVAVSNKGLFGIAGAPGSGKSTLSRTIDICLKELRPSEKNIISSLDDFYLSKADRKTRGLEFRAQPGSHDLEDVKRAIGHFLQGHQAIEMPSFDHSRDDRGRSKQMLGPFSNMILEGMFVGSRIEGYDQISDQLQFLIFIDCPLDLAKRRRFEREKGFQQKHEGGGGFTPDEMVKFWSEVLEPGIIRYVNPIRIDADLVIDLDVNGNITNSMLRKSVL